MAGAICIDSDDDEAAFLAAAIKAANKKAASKKRKRVEEIVCIDLEPETEGPPLVEQEHSQPERQEETASRLLQLRQMFGQASAGSESAVKQPASNQTNRCCTEKATGLHPCAEASQEDASRRPDMLFSEFADAPAQSRADQPTQILSTEALSTQLGGHGAAKQQKMDTEHAELQEQCPLMVEQGEDQNKVIGEQECMAGLCQRQAPQNCVAENAVSQVCAKTPPEQIPSKEDPVKEALPNELVHCTGRQIPDAHENEDSVCHELAQADAAVCNDLKADDAVLLLDGSVLSEIANQDFDKEKLLDRNADNRKGHVEAYEIEDEDLVVVIEDDRRRERLDAARRNAPWGKSDENLEPDADGKFTANGWETIRFESSEQKDKFLRLMGGQRFAAAVEAAVDDEVEIVAAADDDDLIVDHDIPTDLPTFELRGRGGWVEARKSLDWKQREAELERLFRQGLQQSVNRNRGLGSE